MSLYGAYKSGKGALRAAYGVNKARLGGAFVTSTVTTQTGKAGLGTNAGPIKSKAESTGSVLSSLVEGTSGNLKGKLSETSGQLEAAKSSGQNIKTTTIGSTTG